MIPTVLLEAFMADLRRTPRLAQPETIARVHAAYITQATGQPLGGEAQRDILNELLALVQDRGMA